MKLLTILLLSFLGSSLFGQTVIFTSVEDVKKWDKVTPWISVSSGDPFEEEALYLEIERAVEAFLNDEEKTILLDLKQGKDFDFIKSNYKPKEIRSFASDNEIQPSTGNPDKVLEAIIEWYKNQ